MIKGKYYWRKKDITYLRLAYSVNLPNDLSHDNLINIGYETDKLINNRTFQFIIGDDE